MAQVHALRTIVNDVRTFFSEYEDFDMPLLPKPKGGRRSKSVVWSIS